MPKLPILHSQMLAPGCAPETGLQIDLRGNPGRVADKNHLRITPGLQALFPDHYVESWTTAGAGRLQQEGPLQILEYEHILFALWQGPDHDLQVQTEAAYRALIGNCQARGFPHPIRIWNYFGDIHGEEHGLERYQAFCSGRAQALEGLEIALDHMPAATAIGTRQRELYIYLIASRTPARPIENPRQVSAYRYPEQYSPRSPTFARATCLETRDGPLLMLSGTASIVGHESRHPEDIRAQTRETLQNLKTLHETVDRTLPGPAWLRVYLRHPEDRDTVAAILADHYKGMAPGPIVQWAHGDICRRELLIEIEGVHA